MDVQQNAVLTMKIFKCTDTVLFHYTHINTFTIKKQLSNLIIISYFNVITIKNSHTHILSLTKKEQQHKTRSLRYGTETTRGNMYWKAQGVPAIIHAWQ